MFLEIILQMYWFFFEFLKNKNLLEGFGLVRNFWASWNSWCYSTNIIWGLLIDTLSSFCYVNIEMSYTDWYVHPEFATEDSFILNLSNVFTIKPTNQPTIQNWKSLLLFMTKKILTIEKGEPPACFNSYLKTRIEQLDCQNSCWIIIGWLTN